MATIEPAFNGRLLRGLIVFGLTCGWFAVALSPRETYADSPVVRIDPGFTQTLLQEQVTYFVDRTDRREVRNIIGDDTPDWRPLESLTFGLLEHPIWLRLSIANPGPSPAHLVLRNEFAMLDSVAFFEPGPDGRYLAFATGDAFPFASRPLRDRAFSFPLTLEAGRQRTYYLKVASTSELSLPLRLMSSAEFRRVRQTENMTLALFYGLLGGLFLFNLCLYASLRTRVYLLYCACMGAAGMLMALRDGIGYEWIWSASPWLQSVLMDCMLGLSQFFLILLFIYLLDTKERTPRFHRVLGGLAVTSLLMGLAFPIGHLSFAYAGAALNPAGFSDGLQRTLLPVMLRLSGLTIIVILGGAIWRALAGQRQAYFFLMAWLSLLLAAVVTMGVAEGLLPWTTGIMLMPYIGYAAMAVILSLGLADRINSMKSELLSWNNHLEDKVADRTRELERAMSAMSDLNGNLQASLVEARELKSQQDGDYFLTSCLVTPLITNENASPRIKSEINVQQYKQFSFRGKSGELGGDFCMTENISLGGKSYVAFICADAMGKSLQGAGGALVLGASLKSLLLRTRIRGSRSLYPELWLRDTYNDLNDLFLTFNYNMMITCVIGLVDEGTGFMYFINADHPRSVLFRDGRAEFLVDERMVTKLGDTEQDQFWINTFHLQAGDSIYFGSDGREELRSAAADGALVVDETLFLNAIQRADGDTLAIKEYLTENLNLRDDYSLLRIMNAHHPLKPRDSHAELDTAGQALQNGRFAEVLRLLEARDWTDSDREAEALRLLSKVYIHRRDYSRARATLLRYADLCPWDETALMEIGILSKEMRDWERATDASEALFARNPHNLKNTLNLAEIYHRTRDDDRSRELLARARRQEPEHPSVRKLAKFIGA